MVDKLVSEQQVIDYQTNLDSLFHSKITTRNLVINPYGSESLDSILSIVNIEYLRSLSILQDTIQIKRPYNFPNLDYINLIGNFIDISNAWNSADTVYSVTIYALGKLNTDFHSQQHIKRLNLYISDTVLPECLLEIRNCEEVTISGDDLCYARSFRHLPYSGSYINSKNTCFCKQILNQDSELIKSKLDSIEKIVGPGVFSCD